MKLIVTGATGLVGSEVIRLALRNPAVSSVVAVARKPVLPPANAGPKADVSKLRSVVLEDWTSAYPEDVKQEVKDADACIWALAVTPSRSREMDFAHVTTICSDYTINGLVNMVALANKPFRFVYTSGVMIERDQNKSLPFLSDYRHMRGGVENAILDFAKRHHGLGLEVTVTKPGGIEAPDRKAVTSAAMKPMLDAWGHTPTVHLSELAAAMIDQCLNGVIKDPLWSEDLVEIGQLVLHKEDYLS